MNVLPDGLNSPVRLFPDDALLYGIISNDTDGNKIQDDWCKLEQWQYKWQMDFNPSKCKVVCFSTKKDPPQKLYELCEVTLGEVKYTSYLAVTLDHELRYISRILQQNQHHFRSNERNCIPDNSKTWNMRVRHGIHTVLWERCSRSAKRREESRTVLYQNYQQTAHAHHQRIRTR